MIIDKKKKPIFDIEDRGFRVRTWYSDDDSGDALAEIRKKGKFYRIFKWPAYKIFNIAAHFGDIVDNELKDSDKLKGYRIAGSPF